MTDSVISARGVCKDFGSTKALDKFELEVAPGEVHGFLGPNGAGKTTFLRILMGLIQRDEGVLTIMDLDPWQDAISLHRDIAYVPGDVELWPNLTGGQTIDLLLRMRKVDPIHRDDLIERFNLDPTVKVRDYSKGNRQKIALIVAFAADVPLYMFDEPTDGLDPLMAQSYRECVAEVRDAGGTVLLSSHIMSEVEAVADRITLIRSGRTLETGTLAELRHLTRMQVSATTARPVAGLVDNELIHDLTIDADTFTCDIGPEGLEPLLAAVQQAGPIMLDCRPPSLEEIFLRHYGEEEKTTVDDLFDGQADAGQFGAGQVPPPPVDLADGSSTAASGHSDGTEQSHDDHAPDGHAPDGQSPDGHAPDGQSPDPDNSGRDEDSENGHEAKVPS